MCLYVNSEVVQVSDEDITVYKVLTVSTPINFSGNVLERYYSSPYRNTTYTIGDTHHAPVFSDRAKKIMYWPTSDLLRDMKYMSHYVLYGLHTFETYEDAVQMNISEKFNGIVVECTIPKGTRMFKGIFPVSAGLAAYAKYAQCVSYASEVLVVNKIMER